jgi:two-component system, OmpR family, sensor histidine kinase BaeS
VRLDTDLERLALLVHEVRSPIAALAAIAEAVADRDDRASLGELVRLSLRACRSLDRIIGDAALGSLRLEPVDIVRLVEDVAAAAALEGARLRAETASPVVVHADPVRLRQALDNLVANALTHSQTTTDVLITVRCEGDSVVLSVADEGRGIEPEDLERLFAPGTRLDNEHSGQGLGLAVVRSVAEAHGGTVGVESEPGRGATFTIRLPLRASQPASP